MKALNRLARVVAALVMLPFALALTPLFMFIDWQSGCKVTAHKEVIDWLKNLVDPV
jgi:hypothetical protein